MSRVNEPSEQCHLSESIRESIKPNCIERSKRKLNGEWGANSIPSADKFMALAIKYIVKMTLVYHFHSCSELYNSFDWFFFSSWMMRLVAIFHWSMMSFCVYVKRKGATFKSLLKRIAME